MFNALVLPIVLLDLMFFDFSQIVIRPLAFVIHLVMQAIHVFVDKLDLERAYLDSIGNKVLSIIEYVAYLQLVSILIQPNYDVRHTMDFDIVQLMNL